ncbi:fungal Zn binuclear cluster domain-containing [Fusarium albosuccineum]|uniref:Fungal Zn binuclear cluster domain-containing n=1 Tax=Fusarium albosuccineum TaxID=1237068 RepID=A0A8H4L8U8_9HYPO|nr:fungal Zn binuclear cluster domain-containing [Fusarium albosuccineum]
MTLARDPSSIKLWQETVPQIACDHEFFMNGLLAVSALHYAHTHPEHHQEFIIISSAYQNMALQHFTSNLGDINEENCEAFFLLASLIAVASVSWVANPHFSDHSLAASDAASWRRDGTLTPLLEPFGPPPPRRSPNFQRRMERVAGLARELPYELSVTNERSVCLMAIESLRSTHLATADEKSAPNARRVWTWGLTLPPLFLDMLNNDHPVALIILAHFAALARPFEHEDWITCGWSSSVMSLIESTLEHPWKTWIEWPRRCLAEGKSVDDFGQQQLIFP